MKLGSTLITGIACGAAAGAFWGFAFLGPAMVADFAPVQLAMGRYLIFGAVSAALILPRWRDIAGRLGWSDCITLAWLGLAGNTLYYVLMASAVQLGGIAMTSLVIGFLPVAVTVIGSNAERAVPISRLAPSLLLCSAGAVCIGLQALALPPSTSLLQQGAGLLCAVGALVCWTSYAIGNSRALARLKDVSAHDWNLLTGVATGLQGLVLIPCLAFIDTEHDAMAWMRFVAVSAGVAILASIVGNAFWNRMSRLLPLTLAGQMILFETLFALLYGLAWEHRLPTTLETAAFCFVVLSVITCVHAHREPATTSSAQA
ncbi:DMT family transporter [Bradyrhizobium sp. CIAT3101]|uniref:DMT family transporter n=1 Tax=Bradyrhizobium sp. CIAT3101 TaxID=439387 RepID=UPI0024B0B94C|nr:DMT family transporter [Bradyrhizobium sp. CIAT3101]WFU80170.1 DMT family transporter [Bradyrhizobium sp. CIAT3101]